MSKEETIYIWNLFFISSQKYAESRNNPDDKKRNSYDISFLLTGNNGGGNNLKEKCFPPEPTV